MNTHNCYISDILKIHLSINSFVPHQEMDDKSPDSGHDTPAALDLTRFKWLTASAMSSARIGRSPQFCF
jgi:hypothetical protein